jgi:anti-sigma factor RsiW
VSSRSETRGGESQRLSPHTLREVERHVASCADCRSRVSQYQQILNRSWHVVVSEATTLRAECPEGIDWHEVAAGLWPELKAQQLIAHASRCAQCGPRLRAAASVNDDPTPQEEEFLAQLNAPSRPRLQPTSKAIPADKASSVWRPIMQWKVLIPAAVLLVLVGMLSTSRSPSPRPISGPELAEFAVSTHKQHVQGRLALDLQSDSEPQVNEWLRANSPFSLVLPASTEPPAEELPYQLQGARFVQIGSKTAAYIAYTMQTGPVSLVVVPDSVAVASGGVEANSKKVSFHYSMVEGYKVVSWSVHGLTYALVSREGTKTQRSCMVCHSAMRDRDLSRTPTPLPEQEKVPEPVWQ